MSTASVVAQVRGELLVGGQWVGTPQRFTVINPANGDVLAEVADATPEDGRRALAAAADAQDGWAATDPRERSVVLARAFALVTERADVLATLMTLEMGKPLTQALGEVAYGAEFLRWFSEEAVRIHGRYGVAPAGGRRVVTMKQPVGPVYAITPWNFPLAMGARKIAPAIAAGCTVVLKPAPQTPLTTLALAALMIEAGLPAGVLNVVTTTHAHALSSALISDRALRKLTFTGSTEVGRQLLAQAAPQVLRVSMELGGNAPFVVFADADLDLAVQEAMLAKMRNIGEACTAANRFIVHSSVADEFARRLAWRMGNLRVGDGLTEGVEVGPLIDADAVAKVSDLVDDARSAGARILTGGSPIGDRGYFYAPTVLADVPANARVFSEEIFGPVAPVFTFDTDEEAIELANRTEYGLIGYVFTQNLSTALRSAEALQTGMVGVNAGVISDPSAPFGGVKASGLGREGGSEGIEEYLETKYVALVP